MLAIQFVFFLMVSQGIKLATCGSNKARVQLIITAHNGKTDASDKLSLKLEELDSATDVTVKLGQPKVKQDGEKTVDFMPIPWDYTFNVAQPFRVTLSNANTGDMSEFDTNLGELVSEGKSKEIPDGHGPDDPYLSITAKEIKKTGNMVCLEISGVNILEPKSPPMTTSYVIISRPEIATNGKEREMSGKENSERIYYTELKAGPTPSWRIVIPYEELVIKDTKEILRFKLYRGDSTGSTFLGGFETNYAELEKFAKDKNTVKLVNKKNSQYAGSIKIDSMAKKTGDTFLKLISELEVKLDFIVFFDWTGSNGDLNNPNIAPFSLHRNAKTTGNQYTETTWGLGGILQNYDHDKKYDGWGFGGWEIKRPHSAIPNNDEGIVFPLKGIDKNPECIGVQGIIDAYGGAFTMFALWGPTNFAPAIEQAIKKVKESQADGKAYFVVVIMTDGAISDMPATKKVIIDNCELNFSIIIVGIFNPKNTKEENAVIFQAMNELDGDGDTPLTLIGQDGKVLRSTRDNVQFVGTEDYFDSNLIGPGKKFATQKIARKAFGEVTLEELPGNLLQKMMTRL